MARPNILLITSDQQRGDCYGFEGRRVKTPHLDQLAGEGTRFANCITPNAVCQPSRASILTGQLPLTHGVHDNGIDLDPALGEQGFAGALGRAGYDTGFIGKAHFSTYGTFAATGTPECMKSTASYGDDWTGPYMGFEKVELMIVGHNWFLPQEPPFGQHYERWYHAGGQGEERNRLYQTQLAPLSQAAQTFHSALPEEWHNSTWTADRTIAYLNDAARQERPFCLWASFPDPHHPFDAPEPWSRLHHPDEVDLPVHRRRDLERRPWWHRACLENDPEGAQEWADLRKNFSRIPEQNDGQLRDIIANTYGMISLIDHNVGRILMALSESGLDHSTIVVFTSDHGDWLGDHGLILKGPMHYEGLLHEGLLRVGMIVRGPGVPAGTIVNDPVSTLDLGASFYDYAGAGALLEQHGRSLRPLIEGRGAARDYALNEWELLPSRAGVQLSLRTVRTKSAKLTVDLRSEAGELYDLAEDPDELVNRFDDDAYAGRRRELMDMIRARPDDARGELSTQVGAA